MVHETPTTLRGALIGCGYVSRFHLEAWQQVAGARIVGLCDLDPVRLEHAAALTPGARPYPDARAAFRDGPLDFVEICTRPEAHPELVALAAAHGAHVLCQKPAALSRPDFLAMIGSCAEAGTRLMIHENWRFRPWSLKTHMKMEMLRTKGPEMVRKEIALHLLAYNLIRGLMAEAARVEVVQPRALSFLGAVHTVRAFEEGHLYDPARIEADLPRLLELIGEKRLEDRPGRSEPRAVKRRPKPHPLLRMTRQKAKALIKRGVIPYNKA
jgi:hypothetical protein